MRLTEKQAQRLINLAAMGPLDPRPIDAELTGWIQNYDDTDAIELQDGAINRLYDENGMIRAEITPWPRRSK